MTVENFTPPGRISADQIEALLDEHTPDEWLPAALRVPLQVGMLACAIALVAWVIQVFFPAYRLVALPLWLVFYVLVPFSAWHMCRLSRVRQREHLRWDEKADQRNTGASPNMPKARALRPIDTKENQ